MSVLRVDNYIIDTPLYEVVLQLKMALYHKLRYTLAKVSKNERFVWDSSWIEVGDKGF